MESIAHAGQFGGQSEAAPEDSADMPDEAVLGRRKDGPEARPANRLEEAAAGILSVVPPPGLDPALEQIKEPLLREALRFRQTTSGSMTVIVCLDEGAELLVHFAQRDGEVEAIARCDSADAPRLGALWPRLQEALAPRRIRLARLESGASPTIPSSSHSELRRSRNDLPMNRPGWETWA